jgi:hypothetical protein
MTRLSFPGLALALLLPPASPATPVRIESAAGVVAQLDAATGRYEILTKEPPWKFAGDMGRRVRDAVVKAGDDRLGAYREIRFRWQEGIPLSGSIRIYNTRSVALFSMTCERATAKLPALFPDFTNCPGGLHPFSHKDDVFAPPTFALERTATPWLLFDDRANAAVISPADQFMVASMAGDGVHEIARGLNPGVSGLPEGFTCRTLMAFGRGIGAAWDAWGAALTDLQGKVRPANDADIGLRYLGYWTDNGAVYYYNYKPELGYSGTLEALVEQCRAQGIPIRYLQLDSWWYSKTFTGPDGKEGHVKNPALPEGEWNRYGGLLKYEAHPGVLPNGLAAFRKKTGLPLITHNRWMDPASPYHAKYRISGFGAVDPRWWNDIMNYLATGGVVCYEQDWLNVIYEHSPAFQTTPGTGDAFADNMARAAAAAGLSLQYCMALPRYFLQASRYSNLTTIRVADDRFRRERWDAFLYNSQFARSVGAWPWADVFLSTETNNLLLATLSGGMVGIGDAIGEVNKQNLLRAARPDGVLVKPDAAIVPVDDAYLADAAGRKSPMVAWTHTDHGTLRTAYVFAYNRQPAGADAAFRPSWFGLQGQVWMVDPQSGVARRQTAEEPFSFHLGPRDTAYYIVAAIGPSGLAFCGDEGKFVSNGRKRIAELLDAPGRLTATVLFAAGEKSVRLFGYADRAPRAMARRGSIGAVSYEASTGRFSAEVMPSSAVSDESPGGDPCQTAIVELTSDQR